MSRFSPQSLGQLHGELRKIDWQEETKVGLGPTLDVKLTEQSASTRVYACLGVAKAHPMLQSAAGQQTLPACPGSTAPSAQARSETPCAVPDGHISF